MSTTFAEAGSTDADWIGWLKRELAPTRARKIRTAILVVGVVFCVIVSMALQVPELALTAYMVFFVSKENKKLTTTTGLGGLIGVTIAVAVTLLLYKFTYGYPELRIPGMAIALFLGMWLSRILVIGPIGFIIGFLVAYTQSISDQSPSPELLVRAALWVWVAVAYGAALIVVLTLLLLPDSAEAAAHPPKSKSELVAGRVRPTGGPAGHHLLKPGAFTNPAHVQFALKVTLGAMFCYILYSAIDWTGIHTAFIKFILSAYRTGMLRDRYEQISLMK